MLTEGITKLRAVEAERDPVGYNTEKELCRGMTDMEMYVQGLQVQDIWSKQGPLNAVPLSRPEKSRVSLSGNLSNKSWCYLLCWIVHYERNLTLYLYC